MGSLPNNLQARSDLLKNLRIRDTSAFCRDCGEVVCDGCNLYELVDRALVDLSNLNLVYAQLNGRPLCQECENTACRRCDLIGD